MADVYILHITFTHMAIVQLLLSCMLYVYGSSLWILVCSDVSPFLFSVPKTQAELGGTAVRCASTAIGYVKYMEFVFMEINIIFVKYSIAVLVIFVP